MAKRRKMDISFPLGGLDRQRAYRQQSPYTSPDCVNVRPRATIEGRGRGGSRPGLITSHIDNLGGKVRFLESMTLALGDNFTAYSDTFSGKIIGAEWTQASWSSNVPNILQPGLASVDTSVADAAVVRDSLDIDSSNAYTAELFIAPWGGAHHGEYYLYLRMNDTTPDSTDEGLVVTLILTGSAGAYSGTAVELLAGTPESEPLAPSTTGKADAAWFIAEVTGDVIKVYWNDILLLTHTLTTSHSGLRVGFGMKTTEAGGVNLANTFRSQYYSTTPVSTLRTKLVGSGNGNVFHEERYGRMTQVTSSLSVIDGAQMDVAQSGQQLFIADYGELRVTGTDGVITTTTLDDTGNTNDWSSYGISVNDDVVVISNGTGSVVNGTYEIASVAAGSVTLASSAGASGNCTYRIERSPKVYDPADNTLAQMTATVGEVPTGCPLMCRYLDRLVMGGAQIAPQAWYMSRQANPLDWDYSQEDSQRAVAGTASEAGIPGEALTALIPFSDDYLIMGCRNSIWRLNGDPAYGGSLGAVSREIGIIGQHAWCRGPKNELIFLSLDGVYALPPGGGGSPTPLSRERLPNEFSNINPDIMSASLEYDVHGRGVHVFLTYEQSNSRWHWWLDWEEKTFWPVSLTAAHEPTTTVSQQGATVEDDGVVLGCRDGTLRRFSELSEVDDGISYSSSVTIGPVALAPDMYFGSMISMKAVVGESGGDVVWALKPAATFEAAISASSQDTGTWVAGNNPTDYPACRGQAYVITLTGEADRKWSFEYMSTIVREAGRSRI